MQNLSTEILNRAVSTNPSVVKSMLVELVAKTQFLSKKDIKAWRDAWQFAINVENPQRYRLYDVYTDIDIDLHLTGCVDQRKRMVLKKAFKLVDKSGKENKELSESFEQEWFKDFMNYTLDSRFWGHSLIQFGNIVTTSSLTKFDGVSVVPRKHVMPEFGLILKEVGDEPKKGVSYKTGNIANWLIETGKAKDLGLYLKCSPPALSKKNMLAFWDAFGELFGMPIRIGKTMSTNKDEISKVENMLAEMGGASWGLFPIGTEIEIKETTRGDAFEVYDKRIDRANSEMSKGVLNQTMTIDDGSSRSQGQVHLEVFQNVIESDADFLRDVINNKLLPFMEMHGFPVKDHRFDWDESVELTAQEQYNVEQLLLQNYDIDPKYFSEKYNIPILGKKEPNVNSFFE
jgi:hypothetical protein